MKNFYRIQGVIILLLIHLALKAQNGQGTFTVQQQGIKVVGETIFSSPNPKTNKDATEPLLLDYSQVFTGFFKLIPGTHGIIGTIDKPGGKITLEVFAYTPDEPDGIQKLTLSNGTKVPRIVYSCYIDKSTEVGGTLRTFQAQTTLVDYGYLYDRKQPDKITAYGKATSTDLKTLGAGCKNGFKTSECVNTLWSNWYWITNGLKVNLFFIQKDQLEPYACADVVQNYSGGTQPVIVRLTVKDATLKDFAVPAMSPHGISSVLSLETKTIKRIKKVRITILEPSTVHRTTDFYKEKIASIIKISNRHFNDRTGRVKPTAVTAEVGNFGIIFKDIDLVIKKAEKQGYNYKAQDELAALMNESGYVSGSFQNSINVVYLTTLSDGHPMGSITIHKAGLIDVDEISFIIHDFGFAFSPSKAKDYIEATGPSSGFFTHEVGHYFGLLHPFEGGCKGGDGISDTPPCEGDYWNVENRKVIKNACDNPPTQCGQRRQIENMMDYGPCGWFFTKGQVDEMNKMISIAPHLYVNEQVTVGNELPDLTINLSDLRGAASGKVNFKSETVADDQGLLQEEALLETPSLDFTLYPNPTEGPLHLDYTMPRAGTGQLSVRDFMGKIVYEEKLSFVAGRNSRYLEHLKLLPNTHYLLRFESEAFTQILRFMSK